MVRDCFRLQRLVHAVFHSRQCNVCCVAGLNYLLTELVHAGAGRFTARRSLNSAHRCIVMHGEI